MPAINYVIENGKRVARDPSKVRITDLVHDFGTADGTVEDMPVTYDNVIADNNLKDITAKVAEITALLRNRTVAAL